MSHSCSLLDENSRASHGGADARRQAGAGARVSLADESRVTSADQSVHRRSIRRYSQERVVKPTVERSLLLSEPDLAV